MESFSVFLAKNGLIHPETGARLLRFCWCTDGPYDIRDFLVKQCFISKVSAKTSVCDEQFKHDATQIPIPEWIKGNIINVRLLVARSTKRRVSPNTSFQRLVLIGIANRTAHEDILSPYRTNLTFSAFHLSKADNIAELTLVNLHMYTVHSI